MGRYRSINGKVQEDEQEKYSIDGTEGKYEKRSFGKVVQSKKLNKKDVDKFVNEQKPGYFITDSIFNVALNILKDWNDFVDNSKTHHEIQPGIRNKDKVKFTKNK